MKKFSNKSFYKYVFIMILVVSSLGSLNAATSLTKITKMETETEVSTSNYKLSKTEKIKLQVSKKIRVLKNIFVKKIKKYITKSKESLEYGIGMFLIIMVVFGVALALTGLFAEMWWLLIVIGLLYMLMF